MSKVKTFARYTFNRKTLHNELQKLTAQKNGIQESVEYGRREGKSPTFVAKQWLQDVEEAERDARQLLDAITERAPRVCTSQCRIRLRYCQSKHMAKMRKRVKELIDSCDFPVMLQNSPIWAVEKMPAASLHGQEMAGKMLNQLTDFIKDDKVSRVGVWGMGGVGKTTLVKNLINISECFLTECFDIVIWITVPRNSDSGKIQSQIAERLNLEFDAGESMQGRANRVHRRLMKMRKSLLILDDVWEKFDLEEVGIPQEKCKVLLTTRCYDICREMMIDKEIKVDGLSEEASWSLFAQIAGEVVDAENIESVARAVCRRCCGLPLALKAVAKSMRNKKMIEQWKDTLCQLRRGLPCPLMMEIFLPLKLSYDYLHSETLRLCFLYCSLFPENFSIGVTELIRIWIADELIERHQNLEESYNNGVALIENLKDSCMLEQGEWVGTVKMHDVWRDLALWICSNEKKGGFFCRSSILYREMLESPARFPHSFQRISLLKSNAEELPQWSYGKARILLLQGNPLRKMPEGFFPEAKALRYLNLSNTSISSLPIPPFQSKGLHSLLLKNCRFLEKFPPLGALQNLELLDLSGTRLRELPIELGKLIKLKTLNLSSMYLLETIQPGALSGLSNLGVLDMSYSGYRWDRAAFDELVTLRRLSVLQIRLESLDCLAAEVDWIMRLRNFKIWVSPRNFRDSNFSPIQHDEKKVTIREMDLVLDVGLEMLLCNATALQLVDCGGINDTSDLFGWRNLCRLRNLKSVSITRCSWITNILSGDKIVTKVLPNLEHLSLTHLENLEKILDGAVPNGCLKRLRTIEVDDCPRLENLISHALLWRIRNLEEVKVRNCAKMRCIFKGSADFFPNLRVMEMRDLVSLKMICNGTSEWPGLDKVEVRNCRKLRRLPFKFQSGCSVREIRGDLEWWNDLVWPDESTKASLRERFQVFIPTPLRCQEDLSCVYASEENTPTRVVLS